MVGAKWTPDFLKQFQRYRDYDMTAYLPVFAGCVVESEEQTKRFLYDFQKTLGELLVDAYYRTASETARKAGLGIEAEAGGPGPPTHQVPVDALQALGAIDEMRGEFWPWRPDRSALWVVKETACAAHVYGHPRVHMEAFTGFYHWACGPDFLKPSADRAFCEGMNHVVWHTSAHQPPEAGRPGWVYGAGTHLTPNLVWWPMAKPFLDYLARCSFMLQQGLFVGDVCYYYGDQGSNFVPPKHVDPSLGYGYDYDVANPEVILERMQVRDGRITLPDGLEYELLVLPDREDIDLPVLRKIEQLVRAGATVVGRKPTGSNGLTDYPNRDRQVRELAEEMWGDCDGKAVTHHPLGRGQIIWGPSLREILLKRGVPPDFQFASREPRSAQGDDQLDFIHRRTDDADIYFVRNMRPQAARVTATFRVPGKVPEMWCPATGEIRPCAVYEQIAGAVRVPFAFEPYGSVFVVFRQFGARAFPDLSSIRCRGIYRGKPGCAGGRSKERDVSVPNVCRKGDHAQRNRLAAVERIVGALARVFSQWPWGSRVDRHAPLDVLDGTCRHEHQTLFRCGSISDDFRHPQFLVGSRAWCRVGFGSSMGGRTCVDQREGFGDPLEATLPSGCHFGRETWPEPTDRGSCQYLVESPGG